MQAVVQVEGDGDYKEIAPAALLPLPPIAAISL
jgi:hypothetical protein